jgi:photosystem II stability/assembly factor-like uncharacterized protein
MEIYGCFLEELRGAEIRFNADPDDIDSWSKPIIPIVNGYNYQDLVWDPFNKSIWAAGGNGTLLVSSDEGKTYEICWNRFTNRVFFPSFSLIITH